MASTTTIPTAADILKSFYISETIYMAQPEEKQDFASTMGRTLSPEVKLYQSPDLPYGGVYHGHEGFQKWSEEMSSYFSSLEVVEPQVFEQEGGNQVVVLSTLKLIARETGKDWISPLVQLVKVDRQKGWIEEMRPFYWDVAGLNRAVGKST